MYPRMKKRAYIVIIHKHRLGEKLYHVNGPWVAPSKDPLQKHCRISQKCLSLSFLNDLRFSLAPLTAFAFVSPPPPLHPHYFFIPLVTPPPCSSFFVPPVLAPLVPSPGVVPSIRLHHPKSSSAPPPLPPPHPNMYACQLQHSLVHI